MQGFHGVAVDCATDQFCKRNHWMHGMESHVKIKCSICLKRGPRVIDTKFLEQNKLLIIYWLNLKEAKFWERWEILNTNDNLRRNKLRGRGHKQQQLAGATEEAL